jgi:hypothetical protein
MVHGIMASSNKSDRITLKGGILQPDVADAARALFLVKLRILRKFDRGKPLPQITYAFMRNALKVVGKPTNRGRPPKGRDKLASFYDKHFQPRAMLLRRMSI